LWGNWNLAAPTLKELPGRTLAFSKAIRAVDPAARLIATGQDPDHYEEWNAAQLSNPKGTFDYLSTHFVVTTDHTESKTKDPDALAADTFALPVELGRRVREMQRQVDESSNFRHRAHIAFTEWLFVCCGDRKADAPRWDNMGGAVAAGGFLNMILRNADVVPISDMTGLIEFAGISKRRGKVFAAPAYYAFRMFASAEPDRAVKLSSNEGKYDVHGGVSRLPEIPKVPYLDLLAVLNKAGDRLTLFCVNRDLTRDIAAAITINGFQADGKTAVESLSAPSIYDVNDETRPEAIVPVDSTFDVHGADFAYTFRHESVTRIELTR
jgi:alpha-N-arabinofuranosidase